MIGPGEYVADRTEGVSRTGDLPHTRIIHRRRVYRRRVYRRRVYRRRPCPRCGHPDAPRYDTDVRRLFDLGDPAADGPVTISRTYLAAPVPGVPSLFRYRPE